VNASDIGDITSTAKDYEKSRSGSTRGATDIIDATNVRDIASTREDYEKSKDEVKETWRSSRKKKKWAMKSPETEIQEVLWMSKT